MSRKQKRAQDLRARFLLNYMCFFLEIVTRRGLLGRRANLREREGCRSLRSAFASIWRIAFARHGEGLADFFQRVLAAVVKAKPHLDYFFLARRQRLQHRRRLFLQIQVDDRIGRAKPRPCSSMKSPRCESSSSPIGVSQRNRLLRDLQNLAHLGTPECPCAWRFLRWSAHGPSFLHQLAAGAHQLVNRFDHVHREYEWCAAWSAIARVMALSNPPRRIRRKLVIPRRHSNLSTAFIRPMLPS